MKHTKFSPEILTVLAFFFLIFIGIGHSAGASTSEGSKASKKHPAAALFKLGLRPSEIISMAQLRNKIGRKDSFLLLDARGKRNYSQGHIAGAILPLSEDYYQEEALFQSGVVPKSPDRDKALAESFAKYPKDIPIVTYCSDGCQASVVMFFSLKRMGFKYVKVMAGGFQSWEEKGYPVDKPK